MSNPIKSKLQIRQIKRITETFLGKENFSWMTLFFAACIFLVMGWLPDGVIDIITNIFKIQEGNITKAYIQFGLSAIFLMSIGFMIKKGLNDKVEVKNEPSSKAKILVLFLSPLVKAKLEDIQAKLQEGTIQVIDMDGSPWEMALIGIKHHYPELEVLCIATSSGVKGTHLQMPVFKDIVVKFYPEIKEIKELIKGGMDFENFKLVYSSIEDLYKQESKNSRYKENEIIVDITGGQKPNSVAGAVATLSLGRKFQYISTIDKHVQSYDIEYFD